MVYWILNFSFCFAIIHVFPSGAFIFGWLLSHWMFPHYKELLLITENGALSSSPSRCSLGSRLGTQGRPGGPEQQRKCGKWWAAPRLPCSRKMTVNNTCVQSATWHLRSGSKEEKLISPSQLPPKNSVSISQLWKAMVEFVIVPHLLMMWVFGANNAGLVFVMTRIRHEATITTLESTVWDGPDLILICCRVRFDRGATVRSWSLNRQKHVDYFIIESSDGNQSLETNSLQWKLCPAYSTIWFTW